MIIIQFLFACILVSKNFYRKHSLYDAPRVKYIQTINFYPIKSLYLYEDGYNELRNISYDTTSSNKFSLIQTEKYSIQCLEYYFIQKDEACQITDIKFLNKSNDMHNDINQECIKFSDEEYFYFTNMNKLGKLYKSFNYSEFEKNKEDALTNEEINKMYRKEFNKISNPIFDFKYYIQFFDNICPILILTSLFFSFFEYADDTKIGVIRIVNISLQLIILIIYIVRFYKFIEVKNFLFDNEDIYKNDSYFPNKVFNMDSFSIGFSINIFILNTLYIVFHDRTKIKISIKYSDNFLWSFFDFIRKYALFLIVGFFFISKFIFEIFDFLNDVKIIDSSNNLIYNWKNSPIKSISLSNTAGDENKFNVKWKGFIFQIERLKDFNYMNIYSNNYNQLCGKDNYGNNLYFPQYIDCPINDIFISGAKEDLIGYTKLKLNDTFYLYYTNQLKEGKILIDLRTSYNTEIPLNPGGDSDTNYYSIPFYDELDFNSKYLYSINYLGINSSSISGDKIEKFEKRMDTYNSLYIIKIVFFCIEYPLIIFIFIGIIVKYFDVFGSDFSSNLVFIIIFIPGASLIFINFILEIVCLDYQRNYISNFMNKINFDLEKQKNDYKWNVAVLIHSLFLILNVILYVLLKKEYFEFNDSDYNKISSNDIDKTINYQNTNQNKTNDNQSNEESLQNQITILNSQITNLNGKITILNEEIDDLKRERDDYKASYENEQNLTKELKETIEKKKRKISTLEKNNNTLLDIVKESQNVKNFLKENLQFDLKEKEKLMAVIFMSVDQNIKQPIICKNTQIFNEVENLFIKNSLNIKKQKIFFLLMAQK